MVCKAGVEPAVFQTRSTDVELRESKPKQAVARAFTISPLAHNLVGECGYAPLPVKDEFYRLAAETISFTLPSSFGVSRRI